MSLKLNKDKFLSHITGIFLLYIAFFLTLYLGVFFGASNDIEGYLNIHESVGNILTFLWEVIHFLGFWVLRF